MPYELFLALRYFYSRRRRPLARVTALFAVAGIAFGVAAFIVALALSNGFRDEMRDKILSSTAHITLMRRDGGAFTDYRALINRVREVPGVQDAAATLYDGALISGANNSAYAVLRGLDPESARSVEQLRRSLVQGTIEPLLNDSSLTEDAKEAREKQSAQAPLEPDTESYNASQSEAALPVVIIGAELAARTGLRVGDVGQLISGDATLTPLGLAPRYRRVRVGGIFRSGLYEYDATWIYVSLAVAGSFSGEQKPSASAISLEVADIYKVGEVSARVRERAGQDFITVDWQEANRPLFAALTLERRMGLFIIAIIILLAALNITTTLVLVVVERRADIAILSAMGARARSIMLLFIIEGALIGAIGAALGVLLGLLISIIGDRYRLVSLPADVYSISNVPFHTRAQDVALAALVAFALSLLATIYPARIAARLRPTEALRDQ
ncbi:MAG: ABC transporter permease [Pyrinomonadaceae bacterium]|nr:ABC transporter permease [Pyrinomonadaceae bacterium]